MLKDWWLGHRYSFSWTEWLEHVLLKYVTNPPCFALQIEGPALMQHGFADAIAKVGMQKFVSDLFWVGMFYHLYNQVKMSSNYLSFCSLNIGYFFWFYYYHAGCVGWICSTGSGRSGFQGMSSWKILYVAWCFSLLTTPWKELRHLLMPSAMCWRGCLLLVSPSLCLVSDLLSYFEYPTEMKTQIFFVGGLKSSVANVTA